MTGKRSPGSNSQLAGPSHPDSPSTLRSIEVAKPTSPDNESPACPVYYEPQPLVAVSDHKTIEVDTIKLAEDIDPRKLPTELRLARPPSVAPPDSAQTDVVVVSSQPPIARRRKWRTPVALLVVFTALMLLLLARARASAQRSRAAAAEAVAATATATATGTATGTASSSAAPTEASASASTVASAAPSTVPTVAVAAVLEPAAAPKPRAGKPPHGILKSSSHSSIDPAPGASSRVLTAPSASKPKRAIY